ncbi:response regulator transcription factor [Peribacillus kribbensis]|uniref:response regulator transcription factor n=1 Tax=Peribacillus kribbensis TaxID=356658 RepID=UPI00041C138C|nr:response regulator transcription factor [Peribacillus kribbensis]
MPAKERYRVLIVDDEVLIRQGIKHYIDWEREGYEIAGEAGNGQEALELIESANPDIILTDIVMPVMDGEELTKQIKERYPDIEIIILSSFGDFDYVRSTFQHGAVDYILKPKLDSTGLLEVLNRTAAKIQSVGKMEKKQDKKAAAQEMVNKILKGYEAPNAHRLLPYKNYCLAGFGMKDLFDGEDLPKPVIEFIEETLKSELDHAVLVPIKSTHMEASFLINTDSGWSAVHEAVSKLCINTPTLYGALSSSFTHLKQISGEPVRQLEKLLKLYFYFSDSLPLTPSILETRPQAAGEFNMEEYSLELRQKKFDSAFQNLRIYTETLSRCFTMDSFEYKAFFSNIIFNSIIILGSMGYSVKELDQAKYAYLKLIGQSQTAGRVRDLLDRFIEDLHNIMNQAHSETASINMESIRSFMMEHSAEPITLTDVAKHFHFSPSYLSSYFSANNMESFTEYLNKIRINKAIKLLADNRYPISEISAKAGYSDHSYFCKVFKKLMGVSPSQYKRRYITR